MSEQWRIDELAEVVAEALRAVGYTGPATARVRAVPDARTIRYYTTLGLLDRPLEMRGRTAYYGRRHVLQLVAIKKLQARGASLLEVQRALAGADDERLSRLAGLPKGFWQTVRSARTTPPTAGVADGSAAAEAPERSTDAVGGPSLPAESVGRPSERFWRPAPLPVASGSTEEESRVGDGETFPASRASVSTSTLRPAVHLPLAPGVTLVLEGVRPEQLDRSVLAELEPALRQLLKRLTRHGLVSPRAERAASQASGPTD